jgi:hypothetical protein
MVGQTKAQHEPTKTYRNFPVLLTLQFHSLSLPFKDLKSNFSNLGIGLGTEVSFNGKQDWVQQFNLGWFRNKSVGNGLQFYSQTVWRPTISGNVYTELKAGLGYQYSFHPVQAYEQVNGKWTTATHKGKGMLMVPAGVSLGYNNYDDDLYFSPFASYQLILLKNYSATIPIVPQRMIQFGMRMHIKY